MDRPGSWSALGLVLLVAFTLVTGVTGDVFALTPGEILQRVDSLRSPGPSFAFDLKVTYRKENGDEVVEGFQVRIKDAAKSLVKFTYPPANKGRLLLMVGNDLWIYIPGTRQPLRLSPQQRLLGQIANGDVARVVYSLDYEPKSLGREKLGEADCTKLELSPKTDQATYGRIVLWVEAGSFRPVKAEYYTTSGRLLKTAFYKGYTRILGEDRPMVLEIHDELHKGEYSVMEYSNLAVTDTPDAFFQKDYLKHIR